MAFAPSSNDDGLYFLGTPGAFSSSTVDVIAGAPCSVVAAGPRVVAPGSSKAPKLSWGSVVEGLRASAPVLSSSSTAVLRAADRPGNPICSFFSSGHCGKGDSCRFRHVRAEPWAVEFFEAQLRAARLGSAGGVAAFLGADGAGSEAGDATAFDASFAAASAAWEADAALMEDEMIKAAVSAGVASDADAAEVALLTAERLSSVDVECGICLEPVIGADRPGRRFGLLTGCTHGFCLECIREWRGRTDMPAATVRSCPLCRVLSFYVVPSERFVADTARKAKVHAAFLAENKRMPCRNWDLGRGSCAFGSSCHFAHLLPDGSEAPKSGRHAFRMNADGEITGVVGRGPKLSDFL